MGVEVAFYQGRAAVGGVVIHEKDLEHLVLAGDAQVLKAFSYVFLPIVGADNR